MAVTDPSRPGNPLVWANDAFLALTGYGHDEIRGHNWRLFAGEGTEPEVVRRLDEAAAAGRAIEVELLHHRKDGTTFRGGLSLAPVQAEGKEPTYSFAVLTEVIDRHRVLAEAQERSAERERQLTERVAALEAALDRKARLLRETDHRVKNDLQVISSLMLLKSRRLPKGQSREVLQDMAERVASLSVAHRVLHAADDASRFDIRDFSEGLLENLMSGVDATQTRLSASFDPVAVSGAMAAPLALLMYELVTNAIRHAFPNDRPGEVRISARRQDDALHLRIEDDGVGLAAGTPNPSGFGRSLAEMVVRQLRGTIAWSEADPGTHVTIRIPLDR